VGKSRNAAELAYKLDAAGRAIVGENRDAVAAAADVFKDSVLTQGRADSGGDLRLSRWGKRGVKLGAGYDVDGTVKASATLKARPQGAWKVLEYGAKPHVIVAGLTRRQGQALALFSFMAGGRGQFDLGELSSMATGNRNNRGGTRRRQRARALTIGPNYRPFVNHPGTDGKRTWSTGIARGQEGATLAYRRTQSLGLAKVFD
jgi:hypothetical protein